MTSPTCGTNEETITANMAYVLDKQKKLDWSTGRLFIHYCEVDNANKQLKMLVADLEKRLASAESQIALLNNGTSALELME